MLSKFVGAKTAAKPAGKPSGKPAAKKAVPKKAAPKKTAAKVPLKKVPKPEKVKEKTKAQELKEQAILESQKPSTAIVPTLAEVDIKDLLPPLKDEKGNAIDRPNMKRLDSLLEHASKVTNENRARQAMVMFHAEKLGNFRELGYDTAADYWERRFGFTTSGVKNFTVCISLLLKLGVSAAKVETAFSKYNYRRLAKFANHALKSSKPLKKLSEDLTKCLIDANMLDKQFDAWLKDSYAEAKDGDDEDDATDMVKFPAFEVEKINADTIRAAHDLSAEEERNPKLPIGVTIAKACGLYLSTHGTMFAELPKVINGVEKGFGVKLLVIPGPNSVNKVDGTTSVSAFSCDGRIIMHTSKRDAAKHFGVPVAKVEEILLDVTPYLTSVGYSEDLQQADDANAPVHIDQMDQKQLSDQIAKFREDLGIPTEEWVNTAVDMTLKEQLTHLMNQAANQEVEKAQGTHETGVDEGDAEEGAVEGDIDDSGEPAVEITAPKKNEEVKEVKVEVKKVTAKKVPPKNLKPVPKAKRIVKK